MFARVFCLCDPYLYQHLRINSQIIILKSFCKIKSKQQRGLLCNYPDFSIIKCSLRSVTNRNKELRTKLKNAIEKCSIQLIEHIINFTQIFCY